eukprot:6492836-Prymnesium_polylepis.1
MIAALGSASPAPLAPGADGLERSKKSRNASASTVAEAMTSRSSCRFACTRLSSPRSTSVVTERSCASSTITTPARRAGGATR